MREKNREKGKIGEDIALNFLRKKGYEILQTNYTYNHHEIDIVARDNDQLVIVEVKLRSSDAFENPEDAVSRQKIRFLVNAAEAYIFENNFEGETRFDVVAIFKNDNKFEIQHFEDAFLPPIN